MIFDNVDDPQLDIARFFPTGNRGAILITTRNPECRVHATVGSSKLDQMVFDEAVTLLLRASFVTDPEDETSQDSAKHIVETLGCLALAVVHAGATIRQGACTLDSYCTEYSRHRKQLLDHRPVQAGSDYEHTVYSTWEVSIEKITGLSNKAAKYAMELLNFFSVLHFEGISEQILEKAWTNSQQNGLSPWESSYILPILDQDYSETWNSEPFREAIGLLSSYSLIHIDGTENHISLHPLVHTWIRDRLPLADQSRCYTMSIITLSKSIKIDVIYGNPLYILNVQKHIDSCLGFCQEELWIEDDWSKDRISMAAKFGYAYDVSGRWKQARDILERTLEYSRKTMNEEQIGSLYCTYDLGKSYFQLGKRKKGVDLMEKAFTTARTALGPENSHTRLFMHRLAWYLLKDGRIQESIELMEEFQILGKRILGDRDPEMLDSTITYADALSSSGNYQKAVELLEGAITTPKESLGTDHAFIVRGKATLAGVYWRLNRWQEVAELYQQVLESRVRVYGNGHRRTLVSRRNLAISYENLGRPQDGIRILTEAVNTSRENYGDDDPYTIDYVETLKRMQARYDQSLADKAAESSSISRWTLKKMVQRHQRS